MDDCTFVDILRDRAQAVGDKIAYRFLVDGDNQQLTLSCDTSASPGDCVST